MQPARCRASPAHDTSTTWGGRFGVVRRGWLWCAGWRGEGKVWFFVAVDCVSGVLCRPGGDLLSRGLSRSTIGAEGVNGRVRNGIGWGPLARATRPAKDVQRVVKLARQSRLFPHRNASRASGFCLAAAKPAREARARAQHRQGALGAGRWARVMRVIKSIERLVPVSSTCRHASTPGLSTSWSTTALEGELVSRWVSRLDAFSGYPVRT